MYANAVPWYSGATAAHTSFPVLLSRRRRYDIDHTSPRCEGQVLWRGVLLGGVVQGRAGGVVQGRAVGVVGERVGQAVSSVSVWARRRMEVMDAVDTVDTKAAGGSLTGFVRFRVGA